MSSLSSARDRQEWLARDGLRALEAMLRIREFDSRLSTYVADGLLFGSTHSYVGMERWRLESAQH
jgi:TPP-dependent pyruvate/acetoin dehydrogenase alpha subunit